VAVNARIGQHPELVEGRFCEGNRAEQLKDHSPSVLVMNCHHKHHLQKNAQQHESGHQIRRCVLSNSVIVGNCVDIARHVDHARQTHPHAQCQLVPGRSCVEFFSHGQKQRLEEFVLRIFNEGRAKQTERAKRIG